MKYLFRLLDGLIIAVSACITGIALLYPLWWIAAPFIFILFLIFNIIPSPDSLKYHNMRMKVCAGGTDLLCAFLIGTALSGTVHIIAGFYVLPDKTVQFIVSCVICVLVLALTFWNGIIRVYVTSVQLGIKLRVIGALCGLIPIVHLIVLIKIISVCSAETEFEHQKNLLNEKRKNDYICRTKYPILLVHGVFFRDFKYLNYWGRIPNELEKNGAVIYYGEHQSALSVADSGKELAERINKIVTETGCQKVNIIAHSKGGLDCRYAIAKCGADKNIASLTTINTPHRGCLFADHLLNKTSDKIKHSVADTYNTVLKRLGDEKPDFLSAVNDLTAESCKAFNENIPDSDKVYYQSVGSKLNKAANGKFPLNFTYHLAKHFGGDNDGLVAESSFSWGDNYTYLTTTGKRGISHGDMIDLNRENINGFDVREFYVQLVYNLKEKGF